MAPISPPGAEDLEATSLHGANADEMRRVGLRGLPRMGVRRRDWSPL